MAALSWPVYRGNFTKDPMGVWQGNELLTGLQKVVNLWLAGLIGLWVTGLRGFTVQISTCSIQFEMDTARGTALQVSSVQTISDLEFV